MTEGYHTEGVSASERTPAGPSLKPMAGMPYFRRARVAPTAPRLEVVAAPEVSFAFSSRVIAATTQATESSVSWTIPFSMVRYRESTVSPSAVTASTVIVSFSLIFPSGQGREISCEASETETRCSAISPFASASLQISSPVTVSSRSKQDRDRTMLFPSAVRVWAARDMAGGGSG